MRALIFKNILIVLIFTIIMGGCGANNTLKGAGIGTGAGAALGAGIGAIFGGSKGAAWGAGAGAALGGASGALIGKKMDKQKKELEAIEGAQVESINEGQAIKVTFESGILFDTGKSELSFASRTALDRFANSLISNPDTDIKIFGHTDSTGSDAINNPLSERRAEAVYKYLSMRGINTLRMQSYGFGSTQPIADNATNWGRTQNRRVEIFIYPNEKMVREAQQNY